MSIASKPRSLSFRVLPLTCAALALMGPQAFAQAIVSPDGAAKLKAHIEKVIKMQTDIKKMTGDTYEWGGEVTVEPAQTYYAVTLPYLKIKQAGGSKIDLGMVAINAIPSADEGHWKVAVAMPTPIRYYDKIGTMEAEISIGSQRMAGIWAEEAMNFLKLDSIYENVVAVDGGGQTLVSIPNISMSNDFSVTGPQKWSGSYALSASNITANLPEEKVKGTIGQIFVKGDVKDFKINSLAAFQNEMQDIGKNLDPNALQQQADGGKLDSNTKEQVNRITNAMFDYLTDFSDSTSVSMGATNVAVEFPDPATPAGQPEVMENVKFDKLVMDFAMKDITDQSATLGFGIELAGVDVPEDLELKGGEKADIYGAYIPDSFALKMALEKFPFREILNTAAKASNDIIAQGANPDSQKHTVSATNPEDLEKLEALMMQLGTTVNLAETYIANDLYRVSISTNLHANAAAPYKVVGTADVKIAGLNDVVARLNLEMQKAQPQQQAEMQQALGGISMLQMFGQQTPDPATGKVTHNYHFELKETGQVMLNGADMSTIMSGAGAAAGAGAPQGQPAPAPQNPGVPE